MTDSDFSAPGSNVAEFSVSEISGALKRAVEDQFGHVRVRGEISGYRGPHSSGHAYFALKDDRAKLDAVCWKGTMARLRFRPEEGMEVIATGKLTTFPGSSKYQIVIEQLEPAGAGALMALLEERKKKLAAEGLFLDEHKRALPFMPRVIGVITSPTGAVIRDILHRIADRFPLHVLVWPVRVQGETSGAEVAAAINGFNLLGRSGPIIRPDLLIVARGGGSLEDLWGFNDEALARAAFNSKIPLIAAVGHETDWTLIDYVADRRAPTPTGAAEMAVPVKAELEARLASLGARLRGAMSRSLEQRRQARRAVARALPNADAILAMPRRRFDEATGRLGRGLEDNTRHKRVRFAALRLSPAVLTRQIAHLSRDRQRIGERLPIAGKRRVEAARNRLPSSERLHLLVQRHVAQGRARYEQQSSLVRSASLFERLERLNLHFTGLETRRTRAMDAVFFNTRNTLSQAERMLGSLSYKGVLNRGFAVIRNVEGLPLTRAAAISEGDHLALEFADGMVAARAGSKLLPDPAQVSSMAHALPETTAPAPTADGSAASQPAKAQAKPSAPRARKPKPETGSDQGSLF